MEIPVYQVDAFTDKPFSGNPAAVCPLTEWIPEGVMQSIAGEMNLSETAFFVPRPGSGERSEYDLRWFTPVVEVELCGHATLASGHVIFNHMQPELERVTFHTRSGELGVSRREDLLELDFPADPPVQTVNPDRINAIVAALGSTPKEVLHGSFTMAVFETQVEVAKLDPDIPAIAKLDQPWVIATAPANAGEYDFVSRFFAPAAGIDEDPATGSTHTLLMPYWSSRLGKTRLVARQISKRAGVFYCEMAGDRVKIAGHTVEVMTGMLDIPT
jgi:PhzF family phenazine biosynthesis protein